MTGQLEGKVALITGAARGIGESTAIRFAAEGASVIVTDVAGDAVSAVAAAIGDKALALTHDVADAAGWTAVVDAAVARFGRIDILVANAGIAAPGPIETIDHDLHRRIIDINLNGIFYGMRAVIPAMRAAGGGSIINLSSIDGFIGVAGLSSYAATKWAVRGMSRSAALELSPFGSRVNSVHPGVVDTPLLAPGVASGAVQAMVARQPVPRMASGDEIAGLLVYLASDQAAFVTGSEYVIDGGQLAGPMRA